MELRSENNNVRCCSFCRRPGHTVNNCNSIRLTNFERSCLIEIELSIRHHERPKERYLNWLFEYSLHNNDLIKAYARSKLGVNIRNRRIGVIVYDIHNYHCRIYSIPENSIPNIPNIPITNNQTINNQTINTIINNQSINYNDIVIDYTDIDTVNMIDSLILLNSIGSLKINTIRQVDIDIKLEEVEQKYLIEENKECCICYEEYECSNFVKLDCNHEFCKNCIQTQLKNIKNGKFSCGLCRHNVKYLQVRTNEILEELKNIKT